MLQDVTQPTSEICVVHLARAANGIEPFARFIESFRENPAEIDCDLLIIFKGFEELADETSRDCACGESLSVSPRRVENALGIFRGDRCPGDYARILDGTDYKYVHVKDVGYDLEPYSLVAKTLNYRYFCFLNSFSVILDRGWLRKLYAHIIDEGVGLVGATGSCESPYCDLIRELRTLPALRRFRSALRLLPYKIWFDTSPNYHIRTNAFMASSDLLKSVRWKRIRSKRDAQIFESGRHGLTRQVIAAGRKSPCGRTRCKGLCKGRVGCEQYLLQRRPGQSAGGR